jgi:hypothetical protein
MLAWRIGAMTHGVGSQFSGLAVVWLEPISKSFEEDDEAGKLDKAEEIIPIDQRPDQRLAVDEDTKAQKPIALTSAIAGL